MTHHTLKMYDYHVWANEAIFNRLKDLPQDIYARDIQTGFTSVAKVLAHIYLTDCLWFEVIEGKSMREAMMRAKQQRDQMETKRMEELKEQFLNLANRNKYLLNSQKNGLEYGILVDNPYAGLLEIPITEIVLHIVAHGSYHRGNIATMLRQMGHTSVMQDYLLYLYNK